MSFLVVTFLYPLLLAFLCTGAGLGVERLTGFTLSSRLLLPTGFAVLVVVSQFTVLSPAIAPFSPWVLVALALVGLGLGRGSLRTRWSNRRGGWWLGPVAGLACYVTVALPLIAAGRLTFPGYLLDTTAGFHLAAGEWMLHHGAPLPPAYPAFGAMLQAYYGHGYPTGGQVLLAVTGWLSGQDLLWLYFPFQVFALALSAVVLTDIAERAGLSRAAAAITGWLAAVSAIVTAYAQMGSIKELTALPMLLLMGAVAVRARAFAEAGWRAAIPFALAGGAAVGAIGPSAGAWIVAFAAVGLLVALPVLIRARGRLRRTRAGSWPVTVSGTASALALLVFVFSIPTVTRLAASLRTALAFSGSNTSLANDPGNLLRPLRWVQALGIWLGQSHRVDPRYLNETYALIGVAIACFAFGVIQLARRRRWAILAFLAAALVVWLVLAERGTEWTDAKVLMLTSPVILCIVLIGAFGGVGTNRVYGLLVAAVIGVGVLASDALLYHGTNLAPSSRFSELASIGGRFAGQGPTLVPDFDEYTFYVLRKLNVDGPGFAGDMHGPFVLFGGTPTYAHSYDLDSIEAPDVQRFHLIVVRRSPRWSRPPGDFQLAWSGAYYDVWRRVGPPPAFHVPLGVGMQASAVSCRAVRAVAARAIKDGRLLRVAGRPLNVTANLASAARSPSVVAAADLEGFPSFTFIAPGTVTARIRVPTSGTYGVWLGGGLDRAVRVLIDGREIGAPSAETGGDGNMIRVASAALSAGPHVIELERGGGSIAPGDNAGNVIDGIYLQRIGPEQETLSTVRPQAWRSLCGQPLDWIEIT